MNSATSLTSVIEREISELTGGMISGLQVEVMDGSVVLSGNALAAYPKQLAMSAVVHVAHEVSTIENNIIVPQDRQ